MRLAILTELRDGARSVLMGPTSDVDGARARFNELVLSDGDGAEEILLWKSDAGVSKRKKFRTVEPVIEPQPEPEHESAESASEKPAKRRKE